jgi:lysophospholipase L1-like esterase
MEDWPELNRYRAANAVLPAPAPNEQRVVFMGDSITDGWPLAQAFPGRPYINRGISGQTTPQMLIRFRPDVIALLPRVVVILAGTNDIAGNTGPTTLAAIQDNFVSMCELAQHNGVRVVLASVLPIHDYARFADGTPLICSQQRPPQQILALNRWLTHYAAQNGHIYLDYFAAMVDEYGMLRANLADDGLHPNANGYAVMAPLAALAIQLAIN